MIDELIPHRPPMQLIDAVLGEHSPDTLFARACLNADSPFASSKGVPGCIGLEYLGQTAAAYLSWQQRQSTEESPATRPRPGMLIASQRYRCALGYFPLDVELLVAIRPASPLQATGLVRFTGTIDVVAAGTLQTADCTRQDSTAREDLWQVQQRTRGPAASAFAEGDLSVYLPPAAPHTSGHPQ